MNIKKNSSTMKIISIMITLALIFSVGFLSGCSNGNASESDPDSKVESTKDADDEGEEEADKSKDEDESAGEEKDEESGSNESSDKSSSGSSSSGSSGSSSSSSSSSSSGSSSGSSSSGSSGTTTTPKTITVYVSITCNSIIDNQSKLSAELVRKAGSGTIMGSTAVTISPGSTAIDATRAAASQKGVSVQGSSSYVSGFNGISERDAGPMSGWKFAVNGSFGGSAASQVTLSNGDSVSWGYTVNGNSAY